MSFRPFFLPTEDGQRFCIHHPAEGTDARGAVVYLHPFAEEMNKSRRMAALQSRALARAGFEVLQIDCLGCGDSSGDFGDASWSAWIDDALRAAAWLRERSTAPLWLWGLRTGALLAAAAAARLGEPAALLFWNPCLSGQQYLRQFLRLRLAGGMLSGEADAAANAARADVDRGQALEIAGYALSPDLARGLEQATLKPAAAVRALRWLETSASAEPTLSHAGRACADEWRAACPDLRTLAVRGPAFWQAVEIEEAPDLVDTTLAELAAA